MLQMILSAYVLGIALAIPPGAVTLEIGRRAIANGFRSALTFNMGSISADTFYAILAYIGVSALISESDVFRLGLWIIGGGWLMWVGYDAIRTQVNTPLTETAQDTEYEPFWRGYLKGVGVTLLNPLTILAWVGLAGNFFASWDTSWGELSVWGWLAIVMMLVGVMTWIIGLITVLSSIRHYIDPRYVRAVSIGAGIFLILFGLRSWWSAMMWLA